MLSEGGLSLLAGALSTLSPCVFPLLPLVVGGAMQAHPRAPLAMGMGMVFSFFVVGVFIGTLTETLRIDPDSVRLLGAWLLIGFGLILLLPFLNRGFTRLMTPLATKAQQASAHIQGPSLWSAFVLGGLLGMVWSPCSGPLLASALALVASEGGVLQGAILLGLFGLGAAIPLVAVAYASRRGFQKTRDWVLTRIDCLKRIFGALILLVGLFILWGVDKTLEAMVLDWLPDSWVLFVVRF
jgi:cytochrome c-type biogenesis protein